MRRLVVFLLLLLAHQGWAQPQRYVLTNGTIHTATRPAFQGHLVVSGSTIESVGPGPGPDLGTKIDLQGQHLYPGLIDADSALGLVDIESVRGSRDQQEVEKVNPNLQTRFAYRAESVLIPVARSQGVLVSGVNPLGGLFSGQGSVMRLWGWTWEDATVKPNWSMTLDWPNPVLPLGDKKKAKKALKSLAEARSLLSDALAQARAYDGNQRRDVKWSALAPYARGSAPLMVRVNDGRELKEALAWSEAEELDVVLVCGRDVHKYSKQLAKRRIPVIYTMLNSHNPRADEPYDLHHRTPAKLMKAGVTVALSASGWAFDVRELRDLAGRTVGNGLTPLQALQTITLNPARILGIDKTFGSLEPGKEATMVLCEGNILETAPVVTRAWGAGIALDLEDKQKVLYQRYRNKPRR